MIKLAVNGYEKICFFYRGALRALGSGALDP